MWVNFRLFDYNQTRVMENYARRQGITEVKTGGMPQASKNPGLLIRQGRLRATPKSPGNKSSDQFSCRLQAAKLSGAEGGVSEKLSMQIGEIKGIAKRYTY